MASSEFVQRGPTLEKIDTSGSLGLHYATICQQHGSKTALVQQVDGVEVSVTYSELLRHGKVVAGLLRQHGLGSGDTVMLCCGNTLEFEPILLGTLFVGAALLPVNPGFAPGDMLHVVNTASPQVIISNAQASSSVKEALTQYNTPVEFIPMEAVNKRLKENPGVEDFYLGKVDDPDTHVALVMCSSGTTGKPKAVEISHTTCLRRMTVQMLASRKVPNDEQDVSLNISGPFWVTCHLMTSYNLKLGNKLILLHKFKAKSFFDHVHKYNINHAMVGPDQLVAIAKYPSTQEYDLSSLRTITYGGAPVSRALLQLAEEKLRHRILNFYGMTECFGITPQFDDYGPPGNIGRVLYGVDVKIADLDTGEPLGPYKEGEIRIKSWLVFKCYRGNEQATKQAYDEEGFIHTGDVGYYDQEGYFFSVDRIKDIFKYNGIHVSTADIEEVLLQHPDVFQAAVIGIYHEVECAHATAFVVLRPDAAVTERELIALVQGKLPSYKWLYGGVKFVSSLPKTASGKLYKLELLKMYGQRNVERLR